MANNEKNQRGGSSEQHSEAGKKGAEARNNQGSNMGGNQGGNMQGSSERGFAAMDPEEQRRIASEGGKASHESGRGHEFTSEEAREAGKKGGKASGGGNR
ncbi:KGG domain-containing protein [Hymenobacter chitinivorans]|uniref:Stress-induced acidophilic repeat protein n=1 Tax=Hymenobacter chitinivorans DSM 11115 TaxID=1121954 RepID=A0A2M9BSA6_9BACT|nr:KGG domain-containing protein [Hymenobacter chitinivorans]PJJ60823.1 stress-induced acidophilic repeat protein [Hymenobacter chitinivorans DSM 11115]